MMHLRHGISIPEPSQRLQETEDSSSELYETEKRAYLEDGLEEVGADRAGYFVLLWDIRDRPEGNASAANAASILANRVLWLGPCFEQ